MNDEQIARLVGGSALAFGAAAVLTPRALARLFGLRDVNRELVYMIRFAGTANAALGINLVTARDAEARRRLLLLGAVVDGANCLLTLGAGLSRRTALLASVTNGIVAAVATVPALRGC